MFQVLSKSPADTRALAAALAPHLRAGDVVLLDGDLAAGKTLFVTALAEALGADDAVTSPTFAIAQFYAGARTPILHMDVYRLEGMAAFRDLALDDYFPDSLTLIEWGAQVASAFPAHLSIRIDAEGEGRRLTFTPHGDRWMAVLPELRKALGC